VVRSIGHDELKVALFFPRLTVHSGGVERTLKVMEHSSDSKLRFTAFVSPDVIRDKEVERRLQELKAADRVDLEPQVRRQVGKWAGRFDAILVPSEFWIPALRRAAQAGVDAPVFLEFHQLPYIGTLDVLKSVGVENPTPSDLARLPFVSSRVLGDSLPFFAFQTAACYLNLRSLGRRPEARIMAVTPVTAKNLGVFGYRERLFIPPVHVGMEPRTFEEESERDGDDGSSYDYDAVYVGRFHPHKGFLDVPQIAAHLRKSVSSEVRIAVCGSTQFPRHEKRFEELVALHGVEKNLTMLRWLPRAELYRTIRRSRVLLYPSYVDAFSITVLESLCLGVPVAAYAIDALRMIWAPRTGVFVSPVGDTLALAKVCAELIRDPHPEELRSTMQLQSRRLLEEYTWSEVVRWERAFLEGESAPGNGRNFTEGGAA
jgi:glycosyltransferase involved in cell wall biosynthesis